MIPSFDIQKIHCVLSCQSRTLFNLPEEDKLLAARPKDPTWHRGYSGIGKEQVSQMVCSPITCHPVVPPLVIRHNKEFDPNKLAELRIVTPDHKESFDIGNDSPTARLTNIWLPEDEIPVMRGFRSDIGKFFDEGRVLQRKVLTALAMGIPGAENNFFDEYHTEVENQIRLLHYPSAPTEVFATGIKGRIAAHTVCRMFIIWKVPSNFGQGLLYMHDPFSRS